MKFDRLVVAVSYDVNKDGVKVAVLTFTKSAHRLGETILGIVELNEQTRRASVLLVGLM
jgi:RAB6A-GEF complex partner protein 2